MKWSSQPFRPMAHKIIDMASPGHVPYSENTDNSMRFLLFSSPVLLDQHFPTHFYFFRTGREINSLHLFIRTTITDMAQQLSQRFNKFQMVISQKRLVKHKTELNRKVE